MESARTSARSRTACATRRATTAPRADRQDQPLRPARAVAPAPAPGPAETSYITCPRCNGTGHIRSTESSALHILRILEEEEAMKGQHRRHFHHTQVPVDVATFLLNESGSTSPRSRCATRCSLIIVPTAISRRRRTRSSACATTSSTPRTSPWRAIRWCRSRSKRTPPALQGQRAPGTPRGRGEGHRPRAACPDGCARASRLGPSAPEPKG